MRWACQRLPGAPAIERVFPHASMGATARAARASGATDTVQATSPIRHRRRALARRLHRHGHPHEGLPRLANREPLIAHGGGSVRAGLHGLLDRLLRQAAGTLGLRRLPLPVQTAVGRDESQVARVVRRDCRDRCQPAVRASPRQDSIRTRPADSSRLERSRSTSLT